MKDLLYPKCVTYVSEHVLPISPVCTKGGQGGFDYDAENHLYVTLLKDEV